MVKQLDTTDTRVVYTKTVDYINKTNFFVISPIYFTKLPDIYMEGEIEPIFYEDKAAMGRSVASIAQMIEMRANNIPFELVKKSDLPIIKEHLDMYITDLYFYKGNAEAESYLQKLATFQRELTRNCEKLLANDRTLQNEHIDKNLFTIIMNNGKQASWISEQYRVISDK